MGEREVAERISTVVRKYDGHLDWLVQRREQPVTRPGSEQLRALGEKFGCAFPPDFIHFMNVMTGYFAPGHLEVVPENGPESETIAATYDSEMNWGRWNADLIPFHAIGNGDYYCLSAAAGAGSPVFYHCHDADNDEAAHQVAASFLEWLEHIEFHLGGEFAGIAEAEVPGPMPDDQASRRLLSNALLSAAVELERTFNKK